MGDFNFCSHSNLDKTGPLENHVLGEVMPDYVDVWAAARPGERGYTFDSVRNLMLRPKAETMRYDRILARSRVLNIAGADLVGVDELLPGTGGERVWPSDHFGVSADFASLPPATN